jgi:hypothetical protein
MSTNPLGAMFTTGLNSYQMENSLGHRGGEIMTLKVRAEHLDKAREILRNSNAKDITANT